MVLQGVRISVAARRRWPRTSDSQALLCKNEKGVIKMESVSIVPDYGLSEPPRPRPPPWSCHKH